MRGKGRFRRLHISLLIGAACLIVGSPMALGRTLRVAVSGDPLNLDTRFASGHVTNLMLATIYEPLFTRDASGKLVGKLAQSWSWDDPHSLRIQLRHGVTFQDGTPLTANDVKVTLETVANPKYQSVQRTYLGNIVSVQVIDPYQLVVHTTGASGPLTSFLTYYGFIAPADAKVPNATGVDLAKTPVGTGPFTFVEYTPGVRLVVKRNDHYWGQEPQIDGIVFNIIQDAATRVAALKAGDIDLVLDVPPESVNDLRSAGMKVNVLQNIGTIDLTFDVTNSPTNDIRVRQAIAHAIDKDAIAKAFGGPEAHVATSIFGPGVFGRYEQTPYSYDPELAKKLITEAGAQGSTVRFIVSASALGGYTSIGEAIGEYLRKVGLTANIQVLDRAGFVSQVYKVGRNVNMWVWGWAASTLDPDELMRREFDPDRGPAWLTYKNDELTKLIHSAAAETDPTQRLALYQQAQQIIWHDVVWIPLYNTLIRDAYRPDLAGVSVSQGAFYSFDQMSFGGTQ